MRAKSAKILKSNSTINGFAVLESERAQCCRAKIWCVTRVSIYEGYDLVGPGTRFQILMVGS